MTDWLVAIILYLYALTLTGIKAWRIKLITDPSVEGDWEREYHVYQDFLAGNWRKIKRHEQVGSSAAISLFPYLIHRLTRLNAEAVFRLFPCFIYSLMPVFVYLIARQFLDIGYSTIAACYVLSTFFFLNYNTAGRWGVALGFMSGAIYTLLVGNTLLASFLVILVVVSHYGTAYYLLFTLGVSVIIMLATIQSLSPTIISVSIVLTVLALGIFIWYRIIFRHVGDMINSFIKDSVLFSSTTLDAPSYGVSPDGSLINYPRGRDEKRGKFHALTSLEYRDPVVQVAFGRTWQYLDVSQKIEFVLSWLVVSLLTGGFILSMIWLGWTPYIALAIAAFAALAISIAIPHVSIYYGVSRTYLTALILLAPCFAVGVEALAEVIGLDGYVLGFGLVALYGLCVSKVLRRRK